MVSSSTDWFGLGQAPVGKKFTILKTDNLTLTLSNFVFNLIYNLKHNSQFYSLKWTKLHCEVVSSSTALFSHGQVPAWDLENSQILFEVVSSSTDWFGLGRAPFGMIVAILKTDDFIYFNFIYFFIYLKLKSKTQLSVQLIEVNSNPLWGGLVKYGLVPPWSSTGR